MDINVNEKYFGEIVSQENTGLGIARINNIVVFVENGLPGERGQVIITEVKKKYARGKMISFDKISNQRVVPPCPYFDKCGGCQLQHQSYDNQLEFKMHKVRMALKRIGDFNDIKIEKTIPSNEFNYRNKVTLRVEKSKLGFYQHNSNKLVDIEECIICNDRINEAIGIIRKFIEEHSDNNINTITIRYSTYTDEIMILIKSDSFYLSKVFTTYMVKELYNLKTILLNNKVIYGQGYINEKIDNKIFQLSANSFFQINSKQISNLYNQVLESANLESNETVLDLYCGVGTITCFLADECSKVIGIELVESAIKDAKDNLEINNIKNVEFILGKVEDKIPELLEHKIDVIVLDPPRKGSDTKTLNCIIKLKPQRIVYVSCNPVTLARDLRYLVDSGYYFKTLSVVDMFPQTEHVESVVCLDKNIIDK